MRLKRQLQFRDHAIIQPCLSAVSHLVTCRQTSCRYLEQSLSITTELSFWLPHLAASSLHTFTTVFSIKMSMRDQLSKQTKTLLSLFSKALLLVVRKRKKVDKEMIHKELGNSNAYSTTCRLEWIYKDTRTTPFVKRSYTWSEADKKIT